MVFMLINAKIKTRQKKFSIDKKGDVWVISVTSPPEKNKANIEIIRELSKLYGSAHIVSGLKSSKKVIDVEESAKNSSKNP